MLKLRENIWQLQGQLEQERPDSISCNLLFGIVEIEVKVGNNKALIRAYMVENML